jgi:uncharacterized protein
MKLIVRLCDKTFLHRGKAKEILSLMIQIYIDADGCAVKDEVYRVAARYKLKVFVVANKHFGVPIDPMIEMCVVAGGFDAADDWIVERVTKGDVVVTSDILLAQRCLQKQARALDAKGNEFTEDNIGMAVANRELFQNLRYMGEMRGGPAPMDKKARSNFLGKLDQILQRKVN